MKRRLLNHLTLPSLALLASAASLLATGCTPVPRRDGTWTGRYTVVPVADSQGNGYQAAGIRIEDGPREMRHDPTSYRVAEGDVAYLSRDGAAIVDPGEFAVPAGARVRVSGRMTLAGAGVRVEDMPGKPKVFRYVRRAADAPPGFVIIRLRGKPHRLSGR